MRSVERIINMNWEEIHPPPKGTGREHYLTAVTRVDKNLVEIIDVEKILAEVAPTSEVISEGVIDHETQASAVTKRVLIVDDSSVARKQLVRCLETVGVEVVSLNDGRQAYNYLHDLVEQGKAPEKELLMIISDIEMPEMDGYPDGGDTWRSENAEAAHPPAYFALRRIQPGDGEESWRG